MLPAQAILITGASRGIGAATARRLARPGRILGLNFLSREDAADTVRRDAEARGAEAVLLRADVSLPGEVDRMFAAFAARAGRLDALVCNAGRTFRYARLPEMDPSDFEAQWRLQAFAAGLCCRRAAPLLAKARSGRIVFVVSSVVQGEPPGFMAHYVSAKYALWGLAQALKVEFAAKGIEVHCVFPPMTDTDFIKDFPRPIIADARERSPNGRLATPDEIADRIGNILEPAAGGAP